ncbi:MAG: H+-transporting two-sector ATPase, subunit [Bryobacterales bacterium]|jgi:F-type H+-transporting ATPase subunit b|nr:H+-transporting two-sector ATPase, subunit [Bryobacterales bacterium]
MDATLHQLGHLLIEAIPTFLSFVLLTLFLRQFYFNPIAHVLEERRKATEGARDLAQQAFDAADRKTSEFERALQLARNQIHQEHEAKRREWESEQAKQLAEARAHAEALIQQARRDIAAEVEQAGSQLDAQVEVLSRQIIDSLTRRRAA